MQQLHRQGGHIAVGGGALGSDFPQGGGKQVEFLPDHAGLVGILRAQGDVPLRLIDLDRVHTGLHPARRVQLHLVIGGGGGAAGGGGGAHGQQGHGCTKPQQTGLLFGYARRLIHGRLLKHGNPGQEHE